MSEAVALDPRLHAWRADRADIRLAGKVESRCFVEGDAAMVSAPVASVHRQPAPEAGVDTQFLFGDCVRVFDRDRDWCWVQGEHDGYTGYVEASMLAPTGPSPGYVVSAARTFVYPEPELRRPPLMALSLGSRLDVTQFVEQRGTEYVMLSTGGFIFSGHVSPADQPAVDYVAVAESLRGTPYLWGGASAFGIDCSGLVQLALRMAGKSVLRDSDMQEANLGEILPDGEALRRGDLLFWKGHVAIVADSRTLLHANGFTMQVSSEPIEQALARIGARYGPPTARKRS